MIQDSSYYYAKCTQSLFTRNYYQLYASLIELKLVRCAKHLSSKFNIPLEEAFTTLMDEVALGNVKVN